MENRYRYKWWALIGVCVLAFTAFMGATIVNTALPFFLLGINWGLSNAATMTAVNEIVEPREIGAAMGLI